MPKNTFKKVPSSPLPVFLPLHSQIKLLLWNFIYVLFVCSFTTYIPVFGYPQHFCLYKHLFLKNQNFEFWESKSRNIKNPRSPDCSTLNSTSFGVYGLSFTSKVYILEACKHLPLFDPKSRNMTSLKRHFLKNFSTDFSEILLEDVKLMLDKVLKVSCRYLMSFLSYRENTGGGNIYPPPPSAARVNWKSLTPQKISVCYMRPHMHINKTRYGDSA